MGVGIFVPIGALNRLQDRGSDKKSRLVEQREPEPPIIQSYNLWQASDVWLLVSFGFLRSSPTNSSPVLTNKKSKVPFQTHQLSQTLDTLLSIRWRCQTLCLISLTLPHNAYFFVRSRCSNEPLICSKTWKTQVPTNPCLAHHLPSRPSGHFPSGGTEGVVYPCEDEGRGLIGSVSWKACWLNLCVAPTSQILPLDVKLFVQLERVPLTLAARLARVLESVASAGLVSAPPLPLHTARALKARTVRRWCANCISHKRTATFSWVAFKTIKRAFYFSIIVASWQTLSIFQKHIQALGVLFWTLKWH